jgi:hypothetical protein
MLRVLKPGGTIAFSTWPAELCFGRITELTSRYGSPLPPEVPAPFLWGEPTIVRERLGTTVKDVFFDRATMTVPALSDQHYRAVAEETSALIRKLVEALAPEPERLAAFRREYDALISLYLRDNVIRLDYLMTRAVSHSG